MSAQLRLAENPSDRRAGLYQDSRLCLALATAALSALAALSPAAAAAIEASLDESLSDGFAGYGESADMLPQLRDQFRPDHLVEAAKMRSLEAAIVAKAMSMADPAAS